MSEVRVDPLSGRRTILAPRDVRLRGRSAGAIDPDADPYAAGREGATAPELAAVRPGGGAADRPGWTVRVLPSDAPALGAAQGGGPPADASPALYTAVAG